MRAITVCVDMEDLMAVTLPRNAHHFKSILLVGTWSVVPPILKGCLPKAWRVLVTGAFYRNGATFNKGAAIEEALDKTGREGWLAFVDADIILPDKIDWPTDTSCLYGMRRRIVENPRDYYDGVDWAQFPIREEATLDRYLPHLTGPGLGGYFHLFHSTAPWLGKPPWYGVNWRHAAGYDSELEAKCPPEKRILLPGECLHLGVPGQNWCGRVSPYLDGTVPAEAPKRRRKMQEMLVARTPGYEGEKIR